MAPEAQPRRGAPRPSAKEPCSSSCYGEPARPAENQAPRKTRSPPPASWAGSTAGAKACVARRPHMIRASERLGPPRALHRMGGPPSPGRSSGPDRVGGPERPTPPAHNRRNSPHLVRRGAGSGRGTAGPQPGKSSGRQPTPTAIVSRPADHHVDRGRPAWPQTAVLYIGRTINVGQYPDVLRDRRRH